MWEAASNVARRKAQLDGTGLYLSSCRHQVTQKALNMYRGEIYAYPLLLQQHFQTPKPVMFFWQDVIYKYWPWLNHVNKELASAMKPALSVMHGKGHAWYCEVSIVISSKIYLMAWISSNDISDKTLFNLNKIQTRNSFQLSWQFQSRTLFRANRKDHICHVNLLYMFSLLGDIRRQMGRGDSLGQWWRSWASEQLFVQSCSYIKKDASRK